MNKVLREEKKFLINIADFRTCSSRLEKVMRQDIHNGTNGYIIRSLYYDTPYDTDYYEKSDGLELRRKIRLRCYDPKHDYAMLEMKQKQGNLQLKRSLKITRDDSQKLIKGDYTPLLRYSEPFAAEQYALMRTRAYTPKTIVQYNRKAFIAKENKIRVTFDNRIAATESCFDLFSEDLNLVPVMDLYDVVLEVKYNGFLLNYIQSMINSIDKSELSVSKYVLARHSAYQTHL